MALVKNLGLYSYLIGLELIIITIAIGGLQEPAIAGIRTAPGGVLDVVAE